MGRPTGTQAGRIWYAGPRGWLSLAERLLWEQKVPRSNRGTPTILVSVAQDRPHARNGPPSGANERNGRHASRCLLGVPLDVLGQRQVVSVFHLLARLLPPGLRRFVLPILRTAESDVHRL